MRRALNFLVKLKPRSTYVASFQANTMALLPNKVRYRRVLQEDARYLIHSIHADGGYTYMQTPPGALIFQAQRWDNSNTQYGVLGTWACAHAGLEIPYSYWRKAAKHWRKKQYMNGAWIYTGTPNHPAGGPKEIDGLGWGTNVATCDNEAVTATAGLDFHSTTGLDGDPGAV